MRDRRSADRLAEFRRVFADVVVARAGCAGDARLREAFLRVRRHDFVPAGPWLLALADDGTTRSDDPAILYQDMAVGLTLDVPTGLPSLHARCMHACDLRPGERVVHIGAGSGYFTAILAELVGRAGSVTAYEIAPELAMSARGNLSAWPWVSVEAASGVTANLDRADVVYVTAGVQNVPRSWLTGLAPGNRLVLPLTGSPDHRGAVFLVTAADSTCYPMRSICPVQIVPCIGTQDDLTGTRLAEAFRRSEPGSVQSLKLSRPDDSAWFAGDGWWLSTTR